MERRFQNMWVVYALLSAVFASLTAILAKVGLKDVDSNLATALRTIVVLIMAWIVVWVSGAWKGDGALTGRHVLFLVLSGLATGLSWLFYFKAIQMGNVAIVVPIDKFSVVITMLLAFFILHEPLTVKAVLGGVLITAGTFVLIL